MVSRVRSSIDSGSSAGTPDLFELDDAEIVLQSLVALYPRSSSGKFDPFTAVPDITTTGASEENLPILEAPYRTLLEQMSAIVFMAYLDRGIGEAYVSPQIEATLGFSQKEWLEDPVRWYAS
jgi:PAS domain-containing protein